MKRDIHQEMTEAANKYAQSITDAAGVQSMLSIAFCEGVRWADRHPKDDDPEATSEAKKKYRIEVAELAKQLFIQECSMDIQWAFTLAERFVLSKYSYLVTGDINYKSKK